jgi:hypothetical protein
VDNIDDPDQHIHDGNGTGIPDRQVRSCQPLPGTAAGTTYIYIKGEAQKPVKSLARYLCDFVTVPTDLYSLCFPKLCKS